MKTFRRIIFWMHLVAGLVAGISIFIMCFTGAALAFESEIVAWTERDVRRVVPPADAVRLPLAELQKRVREANPAARPTGIVISADPRAAVAFTLGRDGALYANPYTGEVRTPITPNKTHDFLHELENWHRVLAMSGDNRPLGKAINGACNLAFFVLAVSGLYLWWPRSWSWRSFKAIAIFNFRFKGKARDFNWHNAIGLWSAPILIVLTLTAVPISYRWGSNLIYTLAGEKPPAPAGPGGAAAPTVEVPRPEPGIQPLGYDDLLAAVEKKTPAWESITFRLGGANPRGGGPRPSNTQAGSAPAPSPATNASTAEAPRPRTEGERPGREGARGTGGEGRSGPQAITVSVKQPGSWPRTASTTLSLNPYTGDVLKTEGYADLSTARQIRSWTRFLHTGQALGWAGQLIAGLACLGGCVLVYTGVALSWRRFFFKKKTTPALP